MKQAQAFWRTVPFVRLLIPWVAGIVLSSEYAIPLPLLGWSALACTISLALFRLLPRSRQFAWSGLRGLLINLFVLVAGCMVMHCRDLTHHPKWVGHFTQKNPLTRLILDEPPVEKPRSFKALATVESIWVDGSWMPVKGKLLVYFPKDSATRQLQYGSTIVTGKKWQPIVGNGNPGGFDYAKYCSYQDLYHQVYLRPGDYFLTNELHTNALTRWLIRTRNNVLSVFKNLVPGAIEAGVAEALLIGYRADLDKDLVAAYSHTGVVHIIAISGLHLGMIYGLMLLLLKPFRRYRWMRWVKPVLILAVLWGFSLLAGAAASILRSVVMFSFIVVGESLGRRTNIYNTLAASAFCLLAYDPYYLRDVGFQLSYTAVTGIVLFMKPVYRWLYFKNKLLNSIWELNAITIAAQVFTLPLILLYFHQFPNLFLFTNFVAVPLSGFILYGELVLLIVCKIPVVNVFTGQCISFLIRQMNTLIERTDRLPFAVTDSISFDKVQTLLLYLVTACIAWWLLRKATKGLLAGMALLMLFFLYGTWIGFVRLRRQRLVVYNIPKYMAIDRISGTRCCFYGDSAACFTTALGQQHLLPARIFYGVVEEEKTLSSAGTLVLQGPHRSVLLIGAGFNPGRTTHKIPVDLVILTRNAGVKMSRLAEVFSCKQYVFDNSNPLWKIRYWKKDADSLHLRHHTVSEQGAFETDL